MKRISFAAVGIVLTVAPNCNADEGAVAGVDVAGPQGLAVIDWVIVVLYAIGTITLGWYYSRRQNSTKEYFVGSGNMNPWLIGVSLFATLLSTISYLSMPGESLGKGPMYMLSMLALPAVFAVVGFVLLPVYMKQRVTSAYELLEERLGPNIRLLGAWLFISLRLVWMSLLIYLTAKAMTIMLGVGEDMIPVIALVTGFVAVIYTSLGGLRAVVITDFVQTVLLFGGALLVLATISWNLGGIGWVPTEWNPAWDTQPIFSTDFSVRVTLVGSLLNYFVWYVCTAGGDQTSVQRFMATKDAGAARRALATQLTVSVVVAFTLGFVGFALLAYFEANPNLLPPDISLKDNADRIFPHFIAFHLPPGISGLVVAAMFAAAMSSIDSGVNSITAVVMTDVLKQKTPSAADTMSLVGESGDMSPYAAPVVANDEDRAAQHMGTARWLAFGIGAVVVVASSGMGAIPGNITAVTTKTANLLTTPIFGLFFFALFVPFASPKGVAVGTFCGTATAVLIAFSGPIFGFVPGTVDQDPISFQWIAPAAITVNIVTGCIGSLVFPRANDGLPALESNVS
ncbi:MAG: sodium-coupled permease [Fuerstiella sp.]|nr:sodium-coupled permease [Fuerstiella sp.]MCP4513373.1 sodium-coupled permease [Fuerstiella sp.]